MVSGYTGEPEGERVKGVTRMCGRAGEWAGKLDRLADGRIGDRSQMNSTSTR